MNGLDSRLALGCCIVALLSTTPVTLAQTRPTPGLTPCQPSQLSLGTDDEAGSFNGMSHSGTLLVLRNLSSAPCRIPPIPQLSFRDAAGRPTPVVIEPKDHPFASPARNGQRLPMGHGPVVLPITLAPGAEATLSLYWVSNDVYDHGTCVSPESLQATLETGALHTAFKRRLCGPTPGSLTVTATRFALDPVYQP